ncbi:MAG: succinate dehydrogenase, hydrophobic membrane anchor protein [Nitrospirae bacterium]|nr:succinate dehydrogenase, hydrophobic membrane anchor protein [Nitrospirota bacterium]
MNNTKSHLLSWLGQRITAIIIAVLLPIHIIAIPFADKKISFSLVSERLSHTGWLIFDLLLLLCCVYHGLNGIYSISLDFNPDKKTTKALSLSFLILGITLSIYGILILWSFIR